MSRAEILYLSVENGEDCKSSFFNVLSHSCFVVVLLMGNMQYLVDRNLIFKTWMMQKFSHGEKKNLKDKS